MDDEPRDDEPYISTKTVLFLLAPVCDVHDVGGSVVSVCAGTWDLGDTSHEPQGRIDHLRDGRLAELSANRSVANARAVPVVGGAEEESYEKKRVSPKKTLKERRRRGLALALASFLRAPVKVVPSQNPRAGQPTDFSRDPHRPNVSSLQ